MKNLGTGCLVTATVCFLVVLILIGAIIGTWNNLNSMYQSVQGAKSLYSAALNICSQKISGVWSMSKQYLDHESSTFKGVAEARSGFLAAKEAFEKAAKAGASQQDLTKKASQAFGAYQALQRSGGLAINVQIEAYPQLRAAETTLNAMRSLEEGTNEIKTALDDWVKAIRDYNTYRGSAWPSIVGSMMGRFPSRVEYYEGPTKDLNIENLNPDNRAPTGGERANE